MSLSHQGVVLLLCLCAASLAGCDQGEASNAPVGVSKPQVTLDRVVTEIFGIENRDPTTPTEVYGESYGVLNGVYKTPADSIILSIDGTPVGKVTDKREIRIEIPAAKLSEGAHTFALDGYKTRGPETKTARDVVTLQLKAPGSTSSPDR